MLPVIDRIRFRLLGPLRLWDGSTWTGVPAAQQRLVLAVLLSEAGQVVATDRLIDELWGEHPPKAASAVVRGYVMRLRKRLGTERATALVTRDRGYELTVGVGEVDAGVFEGLVIAGRRALADGDVGVALTRLSEALELWRGLAMGDVPAAPAVAAYVTRLEQSRLSALEDCLQLRLDAGHHDEALNQLEPLVQEHPLRERCWALLMLALHRSGRRGDALETYRRAHHALVAGLGLEPGQQLRDLQRAILSGDDQPSAHTYRTAPPPPPPPPPSAQPITPPTALPTVPPTVPPIAPPIALPTAPAEHLPPAQLPSDNPVFAGRRDHLDCLDELLREDGAATVRPKLICITGTAGVGKSALAVRWAHRVRERFPDGQLFVNLRGFDPTGDPVTRSEAIRGFLDSLGVPPERLPLTLQARIGLYRTLMEQKRILVVLDNAAQEEVVRSLLPAAPGCLVIVTSREDLRGLIVTDGAASVSLGLMSTKDARDLLGRRIGRDRVAQEPHAVKEIIDRCARLPLALSVVAARAVTRPGFSLEAVAGELRDGFDLLSGGETATDPRTVFSWSYSALDEQTARLFRLLGLHPGPDLGLAAVVSLADLTPSQARVSLARLVRANLVTEPEPGRYTWHDLLRAYARQLAQEHDDETARRAALDRVTDHYLHTAHAAARLCDPMRDPITLAAPVPGATVEHLADRQSALRWLRREHTVLLRVLQDAAAAGLDHRTGQLAWCLALYLDWQGHWADLALTQRMAIEPAKRSRDPVLWASAGRQLARAHMRMGQLEAAGAVLRSISGVGGPVERAHALFTWCMVKTRQGRHAEALELAVRAHELFEANGHRVGLVRTLNLIGWSQAHLGRLPEAIEQCRRALSLAQHLGDSAVEANIWDSLGFALHRAGDLPAGLDCYERSLAILRDLGNRLYEADTLVRVGDAFHTLGRHEQARAARREALDIFESLGHPSASQLRQRHGPGFAT